MIMFLSSFPMLALVLANPEYSSVEAKPLVSPDEQPLNCRERIALIREERGLPLDNGRDAGDPKPEPLLLAAVDLQIESCAVLVSYRDLNDIRAVPPPATGRASLIPAR